MLLHHETTILTIVGAAASFGLTVGAVIFDRVGLNVYRAWDRLKGWWTK